MQVHSPSTSGGDEMTITKTNQGKKKQKTSRKQGRTGIIKKKRKKQKFRKRKIQKYTIWWSFDEPTAGMEPSEDRAYCTGSPGGLEARLTPPILSRRLRMIVPTYLTLWTGKGTKLPVKIRSDGDQIHRMLVPQWRWLLYSRFFLFLSFTYFKPILLFFNGRMTILFNPPPLFSSRFRWFHTGIG